MNNMSISEMKREIVHNIKSIDIAVDGYKRRFERTLPEYKYEEELHEEIMDYVYENNNMLSEILHKYDKLKDIDVNDIKLVCWYKPKSVNQYCTIDLDECYGGMYTFYRYYLVIGGENHGNFIINDHPDNSNDGFGEIVYKLGNWDNDEYHAYINSIRDMVINYFTYWEPIEEEIKLKRQNFKNYIERFRADTMLEIYKKIDQYHPFILGYGNKSRELYYAMYNNSTRILYDIQVKLRESNQNTEYFVVLNELRETMESVQRKMKDWFENGQKCVYHVCKQYNIPSEINKQIMCFV